MMNKLRRTPLYRILLKTYLTLHRGYIWLLWQLFSLLPVDRHKIIFNNFAGGGFGDNPKYVAEECIRQGIPYKLCWVFNSRNGKTGEFPKELTLVQPNTAAFVYHMSTAGFWVENTRHLYYFKKKRSQQYIHTAHGGPGIKRIEKDAVGGLTPDYVRFAKRDSAKMDLLLSNCAFFTQCLRSSYWYDGPIMEKGIPKNDIYFGDVEAMRQMVRDYYHLPREARLVLYVPTWREDRKLHVYHLDNEGCLQALHERFGGEWYMLLRMHPNMNAADFDIHYTERILNASPYPNVQELLTAGDVVITDYSSCGFDYIQLDRPSFIYAEDYEAMGRERGFYLELEEIPAPVAFDNEQMLKNIREFNAEEYERQRVPFMKKMDYHDDGHASEAVVAYILQNT